MLNKCVSKKNAININTRTVSIFLFGLGIFSWFTGYTIIGGGFLCIFLILNPVISYALCVNAGVFKNDERFFSVVPVDLTFFLSSLVFISILLQVIKSLFNKFFDVLYNNLELIVPYFCLAGIMGLGVIYTNSPVYGLDKFLRFVTITALACFAPLFIFDRVEKITQFFLVIVIFSSVMCVNSLFSYSQQATKSGWGYHTAFGSNYIAFARTTGFGLIPIIYFIFTKKRQNLMLLLWIPLCFLNIFGLFSAGSRGPVFALAATMFFVYLYVLISLQRKSKAILYGCFSIIFMSCFVFYFREYFYTLFTRIDSMSDDDVDLARSAYYRISIDSLVSSFFAPFLGIGTGGFSHTIGCPDDKIGAYPHNVFLELICETGTIGLLFFLLLLINVYKKTMFLIRSSPNDAKSLVYTIFGLILFMFINSLFSMDINGNRILFTTFGMLYALNYIYRQKNSKG